jgi:hypothetical protein
LYQEAIKDDYFTPKEFLVKVQHLENIEKLVELRQTSITDSMTRQPLNNDPSSYPQIESSSYVHHQNPSFSSHQSSQSNTLLRLKDIQCYHCGKWGHIARNCYQKNNNSPSSSSISRQQKNQ